MNLEEHIRTTLLPVKARLEAQLYGDALGLEKDEPICWPEKEENVTSVSSAGMDLDEGAQDDGCFGFSPPLQPQTYLMSDALADAPPGSHDVLDKRPFSPHHCDDLLQAGDSDDLGRESPPARGDFDAPGARAGGAVGPSMGTSSRKRSRSSNHAGKAHPPLIQSMPKEVEYQCSSCSETYTSTATYNPWWALMQHHCPKCNKMQFPRIDITLPSNVIEYHPALISPEEDATDQEDESGEDVSGDDGGADSDGDGDADFMSSPPLTTAQASKLLVLISHARTCPGYHKSPRHAEVCKSVKYLMLHIRDCPGKMADGTTCPFHWCQPCKQLLNHLVKCGAPSTCPVCSPWDLPPALVKLRSLNHSRDKGTDPQPEDDKDMSQEATTEEDT